MAKNYACFVTDVDVCSQAFKEIAIDLERPQPYFTWADFSFISFPQIFINFWEDPIKTGATYPCRIHGIMFQDYIYVIST